MFVNFGTYAPMYGLGFAVNSAPVNYGGGSSFAQSGFAMYWGAPSMPSFGQRVTFNGWNRMPWGGPYGWSNNPIARGAYSAGSLAGNFDLVDNPYAQRAFFDAQEAKYKRWQDAQPQKPAASSKSDDAKDSGKAGEAGKTEGESASGDGDSDVDIPRDIKERAGDYFDKVVKERKKIDEVYDNTAKTQIAKWEGEDAASNPDLNGREDALGRLIQYIDNNLNGTDPASRGRVREARGEYLAHSDEEEPEMKLRALRAPSLAKEDEVPEEIETELRGFKQMFGDNFDDIINTLTARAREYAKSKDHIEINAPTADDIRELGFEEAEGTAIVDKAFSDEAVSVLRKHRLLENLTTNLKDKNDEQKNEILAEWYLKLVKGITDKEEIGNCFNYADKEGAYNRTERRWNIPVYLEKADEWIDKGKPTTNPVQTPSPGGRRGSRVPAPSGSAGSVTRPAGLLLDQQVAEVKGWAQQFTNNNTDLLRVEYDAGNKKVTVYMLKPIDDKARDKLDGILQGVKADWPDAVKKTEIVSVTPKAESAGPQAENDSVDNHQVERFEKYVTQFNRENKWGAQLQYGAGDDPTTGKKGILTFQIPPELDGNEINGLKMSVIAQRNAYWPDLVHHIVLVQGQVIIVDKYFD